MRFSINRVVAGTGALLKARWLSLIVATLLLGVAAPAASDRLLNPLVSLESALLTPSSPMRGVASLMPNLLIQALMTATVLALVLLPRGGAPARLEALRAGALALPVIVLLKAVETLPGVLSGYLILGSAMTAATDYAAVLTGLMMLAASLAGLVLFCFFGMAPAAAVTGDWAPWTALRRSLALSRRRRLLLFGLWLVIKVVVAIATGAIMTSPIVYLTPTWPLLVTTGVFYTLTVVIWAAVFLELRRLTDPPPVAETAALFD